MTDTPDIFAGLVRPLTDEDREWIDARADELFRESERARGGIRHATIVPRDFRDYFVVTATRERVLASVDTDKLRALVDALTDARDMLTRCTFQTIRINGRYIDRDETVANADAALAALQEPGPTAPRQE